MRECDECNGQGFISAVGIGVPYVLCDECSGTGQPQPTPTDCEVWAMMSEPTGVHMLDSGGESGRAWQRVAGMTVADALALPEATADEYGVTVEAFHYVRRRVESVDPHHPAIMEWDRIADELRAEPWPECGAAFADWIRERGGEVTDEWNTYNWATVLSRTLQGFAFTLPGEPRAFAWLQSHNGADVRGGYSTPHIYTIRHSTPTTTAEFADLYMIADANDYTLDCDDETCGGWIHYHAGDVFVGPDGNYSGTPGGSTPWLEHPYPCPECGEPMTPNAPEPGNL